MFHLIEAAHNQGCSLWYGPFPLWAPDMKPVFSQDIVRDRRPADLHVLVHGAVSGELGLARCHFQVEVVDGQCDYNDEGQNEAQDDWEGLFQAFPLIGDTLVGCGRRRKSPVSIIR